MACRNSHHSRASQAQRVVPLRQLVVHSVRVHSGNCLRHSMPLNAYLKHSHTRSRRGAEFRSRAHAHARGTHRDSLFLFSYWIPVSNSAENPQYGFFHRGCLTYDSCIRPVATARHDDYSVDVYSWIRIVVRFDAIASSTGGPTLRSPDGKRRVVASSRFRRHGRDRVECLPAASVCDLRHLVASSVYDAIRPIQAPATQRSAAGGSPSGPPRLSPWFLGIVSAVIVCRASSPKL